MNFYETMYIVHPILEMGRLHDLISDIEKNINEKGGEVIFTNVMGKKRMAYPIQKQKFGSYVLIQFKSDGLKNTELSIELEHNPNILRQMIISIDESEVKEQTEEVKDQITGLARPSSSSTSEEKVVEKKVSPVETKAVEEDASSEETAEKTEATEE